jgi:tight adherence protein C
MTSVNLITLAVFIIAAGSVWLVARVLLRPRAALVTQPAAVGSTFGLTPGGPWAESLAGQLPEAPFAAEEFTKDLRRAGYYGPYARQKFLALRNGLTIAAVLLTGVLVVAIGPKQRTAMFWTLGLGLAAAVACFTLPRIILALRARERLGRISAALPDALDTISMCLQGGLSLRDCLQYVGQELIDVHPDLAVELLMLSRQADMNSFEFAVQQFAGRADAPEVVSLASLVTQNQRLGTGIVQSLHDYADNLRLKRRQMAETRVNRAELFLLFPVIFCLVPSIFLILWGPPILSLIDFLQNPSSPLNAGIRSAL